MSVGQARCHCDGVAADGHVGLLPVGPHAALRHRHAVEALQRGAILREGIDRLHVSRDRLPVRAGQHPLADNLFGEAVINYRIVIVITARRECTCAANEEGGEHPILNLFHYSFYLWAEEAGSLLRLPDLLTHPEAGPAAGIH